MGVKIECPGCNCRFYIHGYEEVSKCFECNTMFNPQTRIVAELYRPEDQGRVPE